MNFTDDERYPTIKFKATIRCSQGHEFSVDNLFDVLEEIIEGFACNECFIQGKERDITILSEQSAKHNCLACPDGGLMLCDCFCHKDPQDFLELL